MALILSEKGHFRKEMLINTIYFFKNRREKYHSVSNQVVVSVPRAQLSTMTGACRVIIEYMMTRLDLSDETHRVVSWTQLTILIKGLCTGQACLHRSDLITLVARMKSSQLPVHIRNTIGREYMKLIIFSEIQSHSLRKFKKIILIYRISEIYPNNNEKLQKFQAKSFLIFIIISSLLLLRTFPNHNSSIASFLRN